MQLIEMLKKHEGVETHAYVDTVGKTTIGVGRNIDAADGLGLSEKEIDYLLHNDIDRVENELLKSLPWVSNLNPDRFDALVDICFNLGLPRFLKFQKALNALMTHNYELAAIEFLDSRWAKQVGDRAIELAEMIRTGVYQEDYKHDS
jgi:lysozyme